MEERTFQYSVGEIGDIVRGDCEKLGSLDDLDFSNSGSSLILVPRIIGVYQVSERSPQVAREFFDLVDNLGVYFGSGEFERLAADLICVAYDPTNITREVLAETIKDPLKRIKVASYNDLPDFEEKSSPEFLETEDYNPLKIFPKGKVPILEKQKNIYELLRRDYGLTRSEAFHLEALGALVRKNKNEPRILRTFPFNKRRE